MATPTSLTYTNLEGKTITITSAHEKFSEAKIIIKNIQQLIADGVDENDNEYLEQFDMLENLVAPVKKITESGQVKIENGVLYFEGEPIRNVLTERIIWGIQEGFSMDPYINFLKNLMQNPSYRSVQQTFTFIEHHKMGISDDGYILAYKKVGHNFLGFA